MRKRLSIHPRVLEHILPDQNLVDLLQLAKVLHIPRRACRSWRGNITRITRIPTSGLVNVVAHDLSILRPVPQRIISPKHEVLPRALEEAVTDLNRASALIHRYCLSLSFIIMCAFQGGIQHSNLASSSSHHMAEGKPWLILPDTPVDDDLSRLKRRIFTSG